MQSHAEFRAVAISGSPSSASRSRQLLSHAAARLEQEGVPVTLIDLAALPAGDLLGRTRSSAILESLAALAGARVIVASTPVYRALDDALRPLFASLGALTVPGATFAIDSPFGPDGPTTAVLERLDRAVTEAVAFARAPIGAFTFST